MASSKAQANQASETEIFWTVAIGTSATAFPTIATFLANIAENPGAAFVVIPHQPLEVEGSIVALMQQQTHLPVYEIADGINLNPNAIYLAPVDQAVELAGRQLRLRSHPTPPQPEAINQPIRQPINRPIHQPINQFFQSLAQEWGKSAIAILLSEIEEDGFIGLQAVSQAGGIGLMQTPGTDQFTALSSSLIASGWVDEILSPEELGETVTNLLRLVKDHPDALTTDQTLIDASQLRQILNILVEREQIDFSHYKRGTLSRRIAHRCAFTRNTTLGEYIRLLEASQEESSRLRQELLIGVTSFFRDPLAWEVIETQVLPQLIAQLQPDQPLRIWIPACATGEEAYTMAILVDEAIAGCDRPIPVKIFATDLDPTSLRFASKGIYPKTIAQQLSPQRLERYFSHESGQLQVKRTLRDQLIFAPHDLTRHVGFLSMHLISCRNVLIYMQPDLQKQVLRLLHASLLPQGFLLLGSSESLGNLGNEFVPLNQKAKIFQKSRDVKLHTSSVARQPVAMPVPLNPLQPRLPSGDRRLQGVLQFCLAHRAVTCLLVNPDNHLLHIFHNSAQLLELSVGAAQLTVTEVVLPALRSALGNALHRARREQQQIIYQGIKLNRGRGEERITLQVGLDSSPANLNLTFATGNLLILLEAEPESRLLPELHSFEIDIASTQQIAELEYELQQTRQNLQITIEDLEASNQEQQATNEELLAANEELQSTNEELQSLNEELHTVNENYYTKIQELTQLTGDVDNLLRSTEIGVVFLDQALCIRKFTPAATQALNIRGSDLERPLSHFTHNLDCQNIIDLLHQVLTTGQALEQEVRVTPTGEHLLMRIHPYLVEDGQQEGVVLTFVNINELKQTQAQLRTANTLLESLFINSPTGLALLDQNLQYLKVNQTLADIHGLSIEAHIGQPFPELLPDIARLVTPAIRQVLSRRKALSNFEVTGALPTDPEQTGHWIVSYFPVDLPEDQLGLGAVITDITGLKQVQQALLESYNLIERVAKSSPGIIFIYDVQEQRNIYHNQGLETILGYTPEAIEALDSDFLQALCHPEELGLIQDYIQRFEQTEDGQVLSLEHRVRHRDGLWRWLYIRGVVFNRTETGQVKQLLGIATDISDRRHMESALRSSLQEKEVLLKEVHHRVKNNLQIISSLLSLQSRQVDDQVLSLHLAEAQNRVRSMALIHDQLYQATNFSQIDFGVYIETLAMNLFDTYGINPAQIALEIEAQDPNLNLNLAIPCALIVNELVSNALKYAFPDGRTGKIRICLQAEPGSLPASEPPISDQVASGSSAPEQRRLIVADDGIGMPPDLNLEEVSSLGLTIVQSLAAQLQAAVTIERDAGTRFVFVIPIS